MRALHFLAFPCQQRLHIHVAQFAVAHDVRATLRIENHQVLRLRRQFVLGADLRSGRVQFAVDRIDRKLGTGEAVLFQQACDHII